MLNVVKAVGRKKSRLGILATTVTIVVAGLAIWATNPARGPVAAQVQSDALKGGALVELVGDHDDLLRLTQREATQALGVQIAEIRPATGPQPINLPGTLFLDPSRLLHVHSRFAGEAVSIGTTADGRGGVRPLQFGDRVRSGQLLAIVWSKEIGEKKSELMDASSQFEASRLICARLESLAPGVVSEQAKEDARRQVEAGAIAVAKAERTLRSWRMTDVEIASIYAELKEIRESGHSKNADVERHWAEIEVRSAIDGVIVEKSFNVGDMVDSSEDLFKVADLRRLQVIANVYEEDLHLLRALKPEERRWTIVRKTDRADSRIPGSFELIGSVIDPNQRTGSVMGWIDNSDGDLAVGQFITATINLPHPSNAVAIPRSALIDDGESTSIFIEVNRTKREYARRKVSVVWRGVDTVYVSGHSSTSDVRPLQVGDRVVVSGALSLGSQLANLRHTVGLKRG